MANETELPRQLVAKIRRMSQKAEAATEEAARQMEGRDFLLCVGRDMGATVRSLAEISGLSPQRVHQITTEPKPLAIRLREALDHLMITIEPRNEELVVRGTRANRQVVLSRGQGRLLLSEAPNLRSLDAVFAWIRGQGWRVGRYTANRASRRASAGQARIRG